MENQVKVVFKLSPGNSATAESMWCDSLGNSVYRLDNVPIFAYGISYGDELIAKTILGDTRPHFERVVKRSRNWTYRLILCDILNADMRRAVDEILSEIRKFANYSSKAYERFYSFNVPDLANRSSLDSIIDSGESRGLYTSEVSSGPDLPA